MASSIDFMDGRPFPGQQYIGQTPNYYNPQQQRPAVDPHQFDTPNIVTSSSPFHFPVEKDVMIPVDNDVVLENAKKKTKKKDLPKQNIPHPKNDGIIRADDDSETVNGTVVEDMPTSYTYYETTNMLRETLAQIDSLNNDLMGEFQSVKRSRTMKNKYNTLVGLSENMGDLLSNKIAAIREINSSISKSNDLDYKKLKDSRAAMSEQNDDNYVANLYKGFISNPQNMPQPVTYPEIPMDMYGSGIVRADVIDPNSGQISDAGYMSYIGNLTPEQNMMRYENNPDIQTAVIYDASTGAKFFQVVNIKTGEAIPNVPVPDPMFMEDTTLDLDSKIAKNINLKTSYPIIVINDNNNVTQNY